MVTIVSNLSIAYSVRRPFKESSSPNIAFICFFIGSILSVSNISFFSKLIIFIACSFKDLQNSFRRLFHGTKIAYSLCGQISRLLIISIHKEYAHLFLLKKSVDYFHSYLFF